MTDLVWLNDAITRELMRAADEAHPKECAGLVARSPNGFLSLIKCPLECTSKTGFALPASVFWRLRVLHAEPVAIYHSHPSGCSTLSHRDTLTMLINGEPAWPGVDWIVIPCEAEVVKRPVWYTWDETSNRYVERGKAS